MGNRRFRSWSRSKPVKILTLDTTAHDLPWPLFGQGLEALTKEEPKRYSYSFFDEATFLKRATIRDRIITRGLDWVTINVEKPRARVIAYEIASLVRYRRHAVRCPDLNRALLAAVRTFLPDVVLVVMGFHIWPRTLDRIKKDTGALMVNYATDDPFNMRTSTQDLRDCIPLYDIYACTRKAMMKDISRAGCCNVQYTQFGYHPTVHFVETPETEAERRRFASDVAFVGEGDADRVPFFRTLIEAIPNLNLALYGGLWGLNRALRRYYRGSARGRDFRMALGGARIAVNLLRAQNRDDHVMRTFEGPACGAFMLNQRTEEQMALFEEGQDAAYFESPEELVNKVRYYLGNDSERERIRKNGHTKTIEGNHTYRDRLMEILREINPGIEKNSNAADPSFQG